MRVASYVAMNRQCFSQFPERESSLVATHPWLKKAGLYLKLLIAVPCLVERQRVVTPSTRQCGLAQLDGDGQNSHLAKSLHQAIA